MLELNSDGYRSCGRFQLQKICNDELEIGSLSHILNLNSVML
ncbi:hypothetical protein [Candidatus Steffania adelgidicola]|nr:hypothetical protein [Candidatus Steffania adelgidicola]